MKEKNKEGKEVEVKYYINDKGGKGPFHGEICQEPKDAKVTGKVARRRKRTK